MTESILRVLSLTGGIFSAGVIVGFIIGMAYQKFSPRIPVSGAYRNRKKAEQLNNQDKEYVKKLNRALRLNKEDREAKSESDEDKGPPVNSATPENYNGIDPDTQLNEVFD